MIWQIKFRIPFKIIASTMACVFLWQQIVWAGDMARGSIDNAIDRLNSKSAQTFAPKYLQNQQAVQEDLVSSKQAIEDFVHYNKGKDTSEQDGSDKKKDGELDIELKGPAKAHSGSAQPTSATQFATLEIPASTPLPGDGAVLSVTTQAGDVIHYLNSEISYIERSDGSILRNIALDGNNNLLGAEITYADGTIQIIADGKVSKITKPDGTIYNYNSEEIISTVVYPDNRTVTYTYVKDAGGAIIETILTDDEAVSYYSGDNKLKKVIFNTGKTIEYNNGILSKVQDIDGKVYLYEETQVVTGGLTEYVAKLKTIEDTVSGIEYQITDNSITSSVLPDGTSFYYEYALNPGGDPDVYRRTLYEKNSFTQGYSSKDPVSYTLNPHFKVSFRLDSTKPNSSIYISSNYYDYSNKTVTLSISFHDQRVYLDYYLYNCITRQETIDSRQLAVVVSTDIDYTVEYVWSADNVNIYLYESSLGARPADPVYSLADTHWDPQFYLAGTNAYMAVDPSSSGVYSRHNSAYTDYDVRLTGSPIHISEFKFDSNAAYKNLYYSIFGNAGSAYDSIYFNYYNNKPSLSKYHHDGPVEQYLSNFVPLNLVFNDNVTYVIESRIENNTLKLYIYEKGTTPEGPIYTQDNVTWDAQVSTNINGGEVVTRAYDRLEIGTYDAMLLPPKVSPYFDMMYYHADRSIKEIRSPDNKSIIYDNGLIGTMLVDGKSVLYQYNISNMGVILNTTITSDGIERVYNDKGELVSVTTQDGDKFDFQSGELSSLMTSEGRKYLYTAGALEQFINEEGAVFELYPDGKIKNATDASGNHYSYEYSVDGYHQIVKITSLENGTVRTYQDSLLIKTEEPYGLISENIYNAPTKRLLQVMITRYGISLEHFTYSYSDKSTIVTDIEGNVRTYAEDGKLYLLKDKDKRIYKYSYPDAMTTSVELVGREVGDINISYDKWSIRSITVESGLTYKELVMAESNKVVKFDAVSDDGFVEHVALYGKFKDISLNDGTSLLYDDADIIAMATSQGAVYFASKERAEQLVGEMADELKAKYFIDEYLGRQSIPFYKISGEPWALQYYSNTRSFERLTADNANNQIVLDTRILAGDYAKSQGEILLDMRYFTPAYFASYRNAKTYCYDLAGKEISFLIKIPEGNFNNNGRPLYLQAFVKDASWISQYGSTVSLTEDGQWYRVSIRPFAFGGSFDPSNIAAMGIKVWAQSDSGIDYTGQVLVKSGLAIDLPEGVSYKERPLLVNVSGAQRYLNDIHAPYIEMTGERNFIETGDISSLFDSGYIADNSNVLLDDAYWHAQWFSNTSAVRTVRRDDVNGGWIADVQFSATQSGHQVGEATLDLRYDIPGLKWMGPVNLAGKTLKFKVKAPADFIGNSSIGNYIQVFVKDKDYRSENGAWVYIKNAGEWYEVSIAPQMTNVVSIGIRFGMEWNNRVDFNGEISFKAEIAPDAFKDTNPAAVFADAIALKRYIDQNIANPLIDRSIIDKADFMLSRVPDFMPDGEDDIIAQEFRSGKLYRLERGNKTITTFTPSGNIDYITDYNEKLIVDYEYDAEDNFIAATYFGARQKLDNSITEAVGRVEEELAIALEALARQRGIAADDIRAVVAPNLGQLYQARDSLRSAWNDLNDQWVPFWDKSKKSRQLDEIGRAIDDVNNQIGIINSRLIEAYAQLDEQVAALKTDMELQALQALAGINSENEHLLLEIIKDENSLIVVHYYREYLGRYPSDAELQGVMAGLSIASQRINAGGVRQVILASSEYTTRKDEIRSIISTVKGSLENYLAMSQPERDAFLTSLGLSPDKVVNISSYDIAKIVEWLNGQSTHFGYSAFLTLKEAAGDPSLAVTDIASDSILIDILTGVIDIFTKGDIVISMNAMSHYANAHGIVFTPAKFTFDDLAGRPEPTIAHTKGNHYIVVTSIEGETVHFKEVSKGPAGSIETISKSDFLEQWDGYVITKGTPPAQDKVLTEQEAKSIKGAWFGIDDLFLIIGGFLIAIGTIMTGIMAAVGTILAGIGTVVGAALSGIMTVLGGIGSFLATTISTTFGGVASMFGMGSIAGGLLKTAVAVGLNFTLSLGLNALGVDSRIANLTSAFVTGGVLGLITGGLSFSNFILGGIRYATIEGINIAGTALNLDPALTNILSITTGALVDGVFKGNVGQAFVTIAPSIAAEFAYYGISKAGELLGVDPRISYLAGVGIRSSISAGLSSQWKPEVMWNSVQNGLLRGITSVALEWGAESLGLSPLIANLTSAAIAGGLEALLMGQNPVQGIFDTYFRAGTGLLTLGGDGGNNPWLRAAYISQVLDFSQIVQERGIVNALETYATGFLHQQTINEIWKQGGIADLLTKPNQIEITTNRKGETVKRIYTMDITSESDKLISNYIDLSPTYDMLMGFREGNIITHCEFVVGPDGRPQLKNGEREVWNADGSYKIEYVENFNLTRVEHYDPIGNVVGFTFPTAGTNSIIVGADGNISSGDFISLITDYSVSIKDNQVTELNFKRDCAFDATDVTNLLNLGVAEQDIAGFKEVVSFVDGVVKYFVLPPDTVIFNINSEEGRAWREGIEARGQAFWTGVNYLIGEYLSGDPLPEVTSDSIFPLANINLHLAFPGASDTMTEYGLSLFNLMTGNLVGPMNEAGQALIAPSRWTYNTNRSAELIASSLAMGYQFVFDGGVNTFGLNAEKQGIFYYSFDTIESIAVGNSAGVTSIVKSWTIADSPQAENYFLFTPQFISPEYVYEQMQLAGIPADMVTVVETAGDFVTTTGFQNNYDSNGNKKWNYIKLQSGGNLSWWDIYNNHGAAVNGIIDGVEYSEIIVNGVSLQNTTLTAALKEIVDREGN